MTLIDKLGTEEHPYRRPWFIYDMQITIHTELDDHTDRGPLRAAFAEALAAVLGGDPKGYDVSVLGLVAERR